MSLYPLLRSSCAACGGQENRGHYDVPAAEFLPPEAVNCGEEFRFVFVGFRGRRSSFWCECKSLAVLQSVTLRFRGRNTWWWKGTRW